ncbi:hypothetical protein [Lysinibacillus sp. NPDC096212]|uniref:hypothetical protein n=1 Tax=Lysinibacillus sp. NPDC096212 TaxID=3364135 RepID=UPI00380B1199
MKLKFASVLFTLLVFSGVLTAQADELQTIDVLEPNEVTTLVDEVGLTEDEINDFPVEVLRELIQNDAKKISFQPVTPTASLSDKDVKVGASAFEVKSDKAGQKKMYLYGNFEWIKNPSERYTDAMSIGWPDSAELAAPIVNNKISQFEGKYMYRDGPNSAFGWQTGTSTTTPNSDTGLAGVGFKFGFKRGIGFSEHKGYIGQYVYTKKDKGLFTIMIRYGHGTITWIPSFTVYPNFGLGVTPNAAMATKDAYATLSW